MTKQSDMHEFALFLDNVSTIASRYIPGDTIVVRDLYHRLVHVLRVEVGQTVILFDTQQHIRVFIEKVQKKDVVVRIESIEHNKQLKPHITFVLPLLKRHDNEMAIYSLVELGVNAIQLVYTSKSRVSSDAGQLDRLQRVMISAAEQSKNFSLPHIYEPVTLQQYVHTLPDKHSQAVMITFDYAGLPVPQVISQIIKKVPQEFFLFCGPEGDFTQVEKDMLRALPSVMCALTPTVLRSTHAVVLGTGIIRSFFFS